MEKISNINRWMIRNLFWIVPLFFVTIIAGFVQAMIQRDNNDKEIILNTESIQQRITADTTLMPRIDSLKETLNKMK
jgi:hypothetical protein